MKACPLIFWTFLCLHTLMSMTWPKVLAQWNKLIFNSSGFIFSLRFLTYIVLQGWVASFFGWSSILFGTSTLLLFSSEVDSLYENKIRVNTDFNRRFGGWFNATYFILLAGGSSSETSSYFDCMLSSAV